MRALVTPETIHERKRELVVGEIRRQIEKRMGIKGIDHVILENNGRLEAVFGTDLLTPHMRAMLTVEWKPETGFDVRSLDTTDKLIPFMAITTGVLQNRFGMNCPVRFSPAPEPNSIDEKNFAETVADVRGQRKLPGLERI